MANIDTSELEAVNVMLALIGAQSVNSLTDALSEDVILAKATLNEINKEIQSQGWHWNTDFDQEITADENNRFAWEDDWIDFDPLPGASPRVDVRRQGNFLYDRITGTNDFGSNTLLKGDVKRFLPFEDIPEYARAYIMKRAGRIFVQRSVGDETRAGYSLDDETRALRVLMQADMDQSDASMFEDRVSIVVKLRPGGSGLRGHPITR